MPARRSKTLWRNPKARNHREHRSKKGRRIFEKKSLLYTKKREEYKLKKDLIIDDELEDLV